MPHLCFARSDYSPPKSPTSPRSLGPPGPPTIASSASRTRPFYRRTWLEPRIDALYRRSSAAASASAAHLALRGVVLAAGRAGFAIPFYLAPRVLFGSSAVRMLDVEGATRDEFTRIMQRDGTSDQHGYQLQRRRAWQRLFGKSSQRYPDTIAESGKQALRAHLRPGTRRAIRMKISPRRSRCGCGRAVNGVDAMPVGPLSESSSTLTS